MKLKKFEGGLRLERKKPIITIVTVVFNGEKTLERTIKSVINQTYKNFEYIIIDGNSTDKTLNIIKKYESKIDYWVSEKDKGIYDAMNKGVKLSRGKYIHFLNADDYFYNSNVIKDITNLFLRKNFDFVYGEVLINHPIFGKILSPGKKLFMKDLKEGIRPCHQAIFMKKQLFIDNGNFNLKYDLCSDFDLVCKCFLKKYEIEYLNKIISFFNVDGSSNDFLCISESADIIKYNFGAIAYFKYIIPKLCEHCLRIILIKLKLLKVFRKLIFYFYTPLPQIQKMKKYKYTIVI